VVAENGKGTRGQTFGESWGLRALDSDHARARDPAVLASCTDGKARSNSEIKEALYVHLHNNVGHYVPTYVHTIVAAKK